MELRNLTQSTTGTSAGFRARYLIETMKELFKRNPGDDPLEEICRLPHEQARMELCKIRNLGPKVSDCFMLNALGDLSSTPIDVHVGRVSENLGIVPRGLGPPQPFFCRRFVCSEKQVSHDLELCPKAERTIAYMNNLDCPRGTCIRAALTNKFRCAGWVQALLFLFGQNYCRRTGQKRPACDSCPLKDDCNGEEEHLEVATQQVHELPRRPRIQTRTVIVDPPIKIFDYFPEMEKPVKEKVNELLKTTGEYHSVRGRTLKGASLWISCRSFDVPLLLEEAAEAYSIQRMDLLRTASMILEKTGLQVKLAKPDVYIERAHRIVGFSSNLKELALTVSRRPGSLNPVSQAAAAIYLASLKLTETVSQKSLADALGLTEVTVRNAMLRIGKKR